MPVAATINYISKVGDETIGVGVTFSDGSNKEFLLPIDSDKPTIRQTVKAEVTRLNSIEGKVQQLQTLVGAVIE